jgi:transcriptional regulator with XRE-family HTH domain
MKSFGETIRTKREAMGLLLRQVAAQLEIDPSFLSRIETGNKRPTREQVVQLATVLNENTNALLIQYLSERVVYELKEDEDLAIDAIMVAEKRIRYGSKKNRHGGTRLRINRK